MWSYYFTQCQRDKSGNDVVVVVVVLSVSSHRQSVQSCCLLFCLCCRNKENLDGERRGAAFLFSFLDFWSLLGNFFDFHFSLVLSFPSSGNQ